MGATPYYCNIKVLVLPNNMFKVVKLTSYLLSFEAHS